MHCKLRSFVIIILAMTLFSACSHVPDHVRYIPKDAMVVAGINLKTLSKKIMWNVITDSKLFKEMQSQIPEKNGKDAISGIQNAGLDVSSTFYVYMKTDNRYRGDSRVTALVPLKDAGQWEGYLKTAFPKAEIKEKDGRKETAPGREMYVGWNKNLLIIINTPASMEGEKSAGPDDKAAADIVSMAAEMDIAFKVNAENSITGNAHFTALQKEDHDISLWVNYELLMTKMSGNMADQIGMSLSADMFKDAAMAMGFDFKKGKITGDMRFYLSPEMKDIGVALGSANADQDMIKRLPGRNLNMLAAVHIAPAGIKSMLEKTNTLGLANLALSYQNMTVDGVLDAFTGDMAFVMNDFSLKSEKVTDMYMGHPVEHQNQKPALTMSYVIKINKKENFNKLLKMARDMGLQSMGTGFVIPLDEKDSVYIMMDDNYLVASNKQGDANGFLSGSFKSQKLPDDAASTVPGHPVAFYFDVQEFCKNIDAGITQSARDSFMISESKQLLRNISLTGGSFRDNSFTYHLDINFKNQEENSIIQLMDYSMKMNEANKFNSQ